MLIIRIINLTKNNDKHFHKITTKGWPSSMSHLTLSKHPDGSVQLGVLNDSSHGDRTFTISATDFEQLFNSYNSL